MDEQTRRPQLPDNDSDDNYSLPLSAREEDYHALAANNSADGESLDSDLNSPDAASAEHSAATMGTELDIADPCTSDGVTAIRQRQRRDGRFSPLLRWLAAGGTEAKISPQRLLQALILVLLAMALLTLSNLLPVLGVLISFVLPLPLAWLTLRRGAVWGALGVLLFAASAIPLFSLPYALYCLFTPGVAALFMGWSLRRAHKPLLTLGITSLLGGVFGLLGMIVQLLVAGQTFAYVESEIHRYAAQFAQQAEQQGVLDMLTGGATAAQFTEQLTSILQNALPGVLLISSAVVAAISYYLMLVLLRRCGIPVQRAPHLREWRLDWRFIWGVIIGLACLLLGRHFSIDVLQNAGLYLLYIFCPVLFICGFGFAMWSMKTLRMNKTICIGFFILTLLMFSTFFWFYLMLAVCDSLFPFRTKFLNRTRK